MLSFALSDINLFKNYTTLSLLKTLLKMFWNAHVYMKNFILLFHIIDKPEILAIACLAALLMYVHFGRVIQISLKYNANHYCLQLFKERSNILITVQNVFDISQN